MLETLKNLDFASDFRELKLIVIFVLFIFIS